MKVQILNFPTQFRTSQYLIFSPSESNIKAHRRQILREKINTWRNFSTPHLVEFQITPPHFEMPQFRNFNSRIPVSCPWMSKLLLKTCSKMCISSKLCFSRFLLISMNFTYKSAKFVEFKEKFKVVQNSNFCDSKLKKCEGEALTFFQF